MKTGKSSVKDRFITDEFADNQYIATLGPDYQYKLVQLQGQELRLEVWDLVGMDTSYKGMNRNLCREAQGVLMLADITDIQSIEDCAQWKQEIDELMSVQR